MIDSLLLLDLSRPAPLPPEPRRTPFPLILRQIAYTHGVGVDELVRPRGLRVRDVDWARQEVMYRADRETKLSHRQIGARLGGRDSTTVTHGIHAHAKRMAAQ